LSSHLLEVNDVVKRFGGITAVSNATLEVEEGSITSLIGPNGAGKTTLFNLIAGVYRPEQGNVLFASRPISGKSPHRVARAGIVRTFQHARALTRMSVLENMKLAAARQPGENIVRVVAAPRAWRRREREVEARASELLALVKLDHLSGAYAGTLSGGQRKLLEFARALMPEPKMILLDEPMAGVNPALGRELLEHMLQLRASRGLTFLLIEHDLEVVMEVSDRIHVMSEGTVIASGTAEEIRRDARVIDAYLGVHATAGDAAL
jgi:branched-chain amino acid transport system ATP-binding protein